MNTFPAQPVELLTCLLKCDELWERMSSPSTSPAYHLNTVCFTTINKLIRILYFKRLLTKRGHEAENDYNLRL